MKLLEIGGVWGEQRHAVKELNPLLLTEHIENTIMWISLATPWFHQMNPFQKLTAEAGMTAAKLGELLSIPAEQASKYVDGEIVPSSREFHVLKGIVLASPKKQKAANEAKQNVLSKETTVILRPSNLTSTLQRKSAMAIKRHEISGRSKKKSDSQLTALELCTGAGGQAIGLEAAGYKTEAVVEIDHDCCNTLRDNRPDWQVLEEDMRTLDGKAFKGIDLFAAGLPCPPFSIAGKQLGEKDERNLFPAALRLIDETRPRAIMIENVRGFLDAGFLDYRENLRDELYKMGYLAAWRILNASDYGVPQLRPRVIIVALKREIWDRFDWPRALPHNPVTVGEALFPLMSSRGWKGAAAWRERADDVAPTLVGGSKKHGGPDLGPTRAKRAWATLGVDGMGVADLPPGPELKVSHMPRLTVPMVAKLQGFPDEWVISGRKTAAYRQIGNAFPPPVAEAVAANIKLALTSRHVFRVATKAA